MNIFKFAEGNGKTDLYMICVASPQIFDTLPITVVGGSLHMIESHLFGLDYPDYLRMARDIYGGTIVGKNSLFPIVFFKDKEKAQPLLDELNSRANQALKEWRKVNEKKIQNKT